MESLTTAPPKKPRFRWGFWLWQLVPISMLLLAFPTKSMLTWGLYRTLQWHLGAGSFQALLNGVRLIAILGFLIQPILLAARLILRMNLRPPSEDTESVPIGSTDTPLPKGLPWQFWLWQCVPMVFLIIAMPPGKNPKWWFHEPAIAWCIQQTWWGLLLALIFTTWFSQGVLLAFWLVWGAGRWPIRLGKVIGLGAIATLLPAIWFFRHFKLFSSGLRPWSEVLNPFELSVLFLWAMGISFLPAFLASGTLHLMRYRLQQAPAPVSSLGQWQFSLKGLSILTLGFSLALSFFGWLYPASVAFISDLYEGSSITADGSWFFYGFVLSPALVALLSAVILYWRNWRVTIAIFGLLLGTFLLGLFAVAIFPASIITNPYLDTLHLAATLTLGNMISLTISRYWLGWRRFRIIRLPKQKPPQGT